MGGKGVQQNEVEGPQEAEIAQNSTAVLAYQLLNPEVSEEEQAEYQGWVLRFWSKKATQDFV